MQFTDNQDEPGLKKHIIFYGAALLFPLVFQIGFVATLAENSRFFADDAWWKSLTGRQQLDFAILGWVIWAAGVTVLGLLFSFFSHRWQQKIWLPAARRLRSAVSWLGLRLVSRSDQNRLIEQAGEAKASMEAAAGPPKGQRSGVPGVVLYGEISTHSNLYDATLSVRWIGTGLPMGELVPRPGAIWEVHYGHLDQQGIQPQFVATENLGRVPVPWEGVEMLRTRDLQERLVPKDQSRS